MIDDKKKEKLLTSLKSCRKIHNGEEYYKKLKIKGNQILNQDTNDLLWKFCKAIGNKTRLNILEILKEDAYCVCELEVILNKAQPSISHHLRILEDIDLIRAWKKGKFSFYVFNKKQFELGLKLLKEKLTS
ncbi:MAG: ArsR/SmtB family transcription factor [Promethearchaeia archaeon]